ncbi:MAG TPA: efflux transporter outer membrane subunit [Rhodocyclaceae bacterium]
MNKKAYIPLLALLLGGCSFMPEYFRPAAPVPPQWPAEVKSEGALQAPQLAWQEVFPDPWLQGLVKAALENNRDLRIAVARVQEARALYGVQKADRLPNFDASIGRTAALTPGSASPSGQNFEVSYYSGTFNLLSFELDFWGRVKSLSDAALASYLSTEEARRNARMSLIADVVNAALTLREMEERVAYSKSTLAARAKTRELVTLRRDAGIATDQDVFQADGALETTRADLASLERQRIAAANALRLLVGGNVDNLPAPRSLAEQGIRADFAADLPAELLLRRPDVLAAEQKLIAANANIGAARAAFLPRITLTGGFGNASTALSKLFDGEGRTWNFAPMMRIPIFEGGRTTANVDLAEARKVIAVAEYERTIQQAFREVADLLAAREWLAQQIEAQLANQKSQLDRLRLAELRYDAGVISHLELLDAQRDAYNTRQQTVQLQRQMLTTAANLYKALGGGDEARGGAEAKS